MSIIYSHTKGWEVDTGLGHWVEDPTMRLRCHKGEEVNTNTYKQTNTYTHTCIQVHTKHTLTHTHVNTYTDVYILHDRTCAQAVIQ